MSNIFISHSSKDKDFAQKVRTYLKDIGHQSLFLDFDPQNGIPAGRNWEKELYTKLQKCQAVIAIVSESFNTSRWCFAEITHARALDKIIIPVKINECAFDILSDVQVIDATTNLPEAFESLKNGLSNAGIDKVPWDNTRPPYPGLIAFKEEDAPVFFGRENEAEDLLQQLRKYQRIGGQKLLLVLGASGSGKSSLVRAGLIPRLRKEERSWIIVGPFRPLKNPFEELSKSLVKSFDKLNGKRNWKEISKLLADDAKNIDSKHTLLDDLVSELIDLSAEENITVTIFIDQFEELLAHTYKDSTEENISDLFLFYLNKFLDAVNNKVLIIGTLRSDFLNNLLENEKLKGLAFNDYIVKFISPEGLKVSITEPARIAGIELENGLADIMIKDTGAPDALPLLAFTLRELWEQYGNDGLLQIDEYRNKLGGLEGSVARVAEAVLEAHIADTKRGEFVRAEKQERKAKLLTEDETNLKTAFMTMVRIDEEGRYTKRFANWKELPSSITGLLERFVTARLLFRPDDFRVEVAHEALLRTWERLAKWLEEDRTFFIWRKRLSNSLEEWKRTNNDDAELLRGPALGEAEEWLHEYHSGKYSLTIEETEFIKTSLAKYEEEKMKEAQRKLELEEKNKLLELKVKEAKEQTQRSQSLTLEHIAREQLEKNPTVAIRVAELAWKNFPIHPPTLVISKIVSDAFYCPIENKQCYFEKSFEHSNFVYDAAFSPDGNKIVTVSRDDTAKIWDAQSGKLIADLTGHVNYVKSAAFSPDGNKIVTASRDNTAKIWDAQSGKLIADLTGHVDDVESAAFSPDGNKIVTASRDGTAKIWDAVSGKLMGDLTGHTNSLFCDVNSAAFSPDGSKIVTASQDKNAKSWDAASGKLIADLKGHTYGVNSAAFSPDGSKIVTASRDKNAKIWDAVFGKLIADLKGHTDYVTSAAFSPDGNKIVTCSNDSTAKIWDAASGKLIVDFTRRINSAAFSPDGNKIVTASNDNTAKIWDAVSGKLIADLTGHTSYVKSAAFAPDGNKIVTTSADETAKIWDATGKLIVDLTGHTYFVNRATFSPNGNKIVTASDDSTAKIWDAVSGKLIADLTGHTYVVNSAVFSPDGKKIVTASEDNTAKIWDAVSGKLIADLKGHTNYVFSAAFSPDGNKIVTASQDKTAKIWDAATGKWAADLTGHTYDVFSAAFSPNGNKIVTASRDKAAKIWNAVSGKLIADLTGHTDYVASAAFSPDGNKIVTASRDKTAKIWDAVSGKWIAVLTVHDDSVNSAAFSSDGNKIVTASSDGTAKIWDAVSGKLIAVLKGHTSYVKSAAFSPDGNKIVTASADKTAKIWLTPEGIIEWLSTQNIYKLTQKDLENLGIGFIDLKEIS